MAGDLPAAAQNHHLIDEAHHQDILKAMPRRHRVIIAPIPDERGRRHPRGPLLARLQRHRYAQVDMDEMAAAFWDRATGPVAAVALEGNG